MFYAGIGSRKTPKSITDVMTKLAKRLAQDDYILRSGGAKGADKAFEKGAGSSCEIFLAKDACDKALKSARYFHPAPDKLSDYILKLMARNTYQVIGRNFDSPVEFVVCWTPDGAINDKERSIDTGGTGQAISIADYYDIPVFNLNREDHLEKVLTYIHT